MANFLRLFRVQSLTLYVGFSSPVLQIRSQDVLTAYLTLILAITSVASAGYDYKRVLHLSLLFYEAQRSGHLPPNNRIPWRGDSALDDRGQNGEDLTGGYYDGEL